VRKGLEGSKGEYARAERDYGGAGESKHGATSEQGTALREYQRVEREQKDKIGL